MSSDVEASPSSVVPGTIIVLCGLPASGKTTLARQPERERSVLVLSEDVWVARMCSFEAAQDTDLRERIKDVQWDIAVRVAALGADVVLDWRVWARAERDRCRAYAAASGVPLEIRYLDVRRHELLRRIAAHNAALPPTPSTSRTASSTIGSPSSSPRPPTSYPDHLNALGAEQRLPLSSCPSPWSSGAKRTVPAVGAQGRLHREGRLAFVAQCSFTPFRVGVEILPSARDDRA